MDTTFWDNFDKPVISIDEFYENEACEDGLARLLEGRERQTEFTLQDILDGHNTQEDICWFLLSVIDNEFRVDYRRVTMLMLEYAIGSSLPSCVIERASSCIENIKLGSEIGSRALAVAGRVVSTLSFSNPDGYVSGAHKLLNYVNDNWNKSHG